MKIGILGGTFNPIHYGHLRAALEVQEMLALDKIIFIPAGRPPFRKQGLISGSRRYEMTRLAINDNPRFDISDIEVRSRLVSYSVGTLEQLRAHHNRAELYFILGIDAFLHLPKWKQPDMLMSLADFVVISRPPYSFVDLLASPYLSKANKKTLMALDESSKSKFSCTLPTGKKAFLCSISRIEISASVIRHLSKKGKQIKYLLPESVESYIISNRLYKK